MNQIIKNQSEIFFPKKLNIVLKPISKKHPVKNFVFATPQEGNFRELGQALKEVRTFKQKTKMAYK